GHLGKHAIIAVETIVVNRVDEPLGVAGCAVGGGEGHGQRALRVRELVRFERDVLSRSTAADARRIHAAGLRLGIAGLNYEPRYNPVHEDSVIEPSLDQVEEMRDGLR